MSEARTRVRGFGYQPDRSAGYHFEVRHGAGGEVTLLECYGTSSAQGDGRSRIERNEKATLTPHRWKLVQSAVANEFNQRLQQSKLRTGRWLKTATPLAPHFGKELVLLAWAIEDQDPTVIPRMLANWRGLAPEERWWFYTTINASARSRMADQSYGWKAAIKIAFLDEPRDIGLESLRMSGASEPEYDAGAGRKRPPEADEEKPVAMQGRLFAEPDAPDYDAEGDSAS